mmetsp:Transcript_54756/g.177147  ORF Transcript_54756/g.177147 Transcript_54756/m.177147 type:complete len:499 (-) Transcript_54756:65-1561(-)
MTRISGPNSPPAALAKNKLGRLPLEKVKQQLEELAERLHQKGAPADPKGRHKVVVLVLPGTFNPPHQGDFAALDAARRHLAAHADLRVVAAFLAPTSDAAAQGSLGSGVLPLDSRGALCALAASTTPWVDVCSWGWSDALRTSERITRELLNRLEWVGGVRWEFEAWWVVRGGVELGAHLRASGVPAVCVDGASSGEGSAEVWCAARSPRPPAAFNPAVRARRFGGRAALVVREPASEVRPFELQSLVFAQDWQALAERGWVAGSVLQRLRSEYEGDAKVVANAAISLEPPADDADDSVADAVAAGNDEGKGEGEAGQVLGRIITCTEKCEPLKASAGKTSNLHFASGDAAKASSCGGRKVVAHICNDQGNGGRGFFQAIKKEWGPEPSRAYFEWHRRGVRGDFFLGSVQAVQVTKLVDVVNMVCQQGYKSCGSKGPPVRYEAVEQALHSLGRYAAEVGASVHMPWNSKGGAGLDWELMRPMVQGMSRLYGVTVYVYR